MNFFKDYGARRTNDGVVLYVKDTHRRKGLKVKLLNFPYRYKIKQVSNEQFLVTSKHSSTSRNAITGAYVMCNIDRIRKDELSSND